MPTPTRTKKAGTLLKKVPTLFKKSSDLVQKKRHLIPTKSAQHKNDRCPYRHILVRRFGTGSGYSFLTGPCVALYRERMYVIS